MGASQTAPPFANETNDHFSKGVSTFTEDKAETPINSTHLPRTVEVNGSSDAEPTPGFMIPETTPLPPVWFVPVEVVPDADPQPLPDFHASTNPIITITEHAPKAPFDVPSPFERQVASIFPDFDYQVVALHTELCGTSCMFPYPGARSMVARACSPCFCDHLCPLYDDCCPDVQLLDTITLELLTFPLTRQEMKAMTEDRDLYTCEISHMKPVKSEKDFDNFFSMINYCPRTDSSNSSFQIPAHRTNSSQGTNGKSTAEEETAESLELKCENREMSDHWDYHRPLTSGHGVVYRNKFCAQCHGEHAENLTDWNTAVTCDADLLYAVTSAAEAYFLALNTTDCDVRFTATTAENLRRCKYVNKSVISSCNQTGLWRNYDAKIERACASFTSVVKRKYKNAFCYLCNTNVGFQGAYRDLDEGSDEANVGRASFYALLDLGAQDGSSNSARVERTTPNPSNERRQCEIGTTLDPLVCQCRKLSCAPGFRSEGDNCTQVFAESNYFGFKVCSRFQLTSPMPIAFVGRITSTMSYIHLPGTIYLYKAESFPRLGCEDNSTLTVDVTMEIYSTQAMLLREMADSLIRALKDHASRWANWNSGNLTVVTPAPDCLDYSDWISVIPDSCSTKSESMSVKLAVYNGPREMGVKNQMSFSTLRNTTFCPRVNLTQGEFSNFMVRLARLDLDESNITVDVTRERQATFYLLCVEDFHKILLPDACVSTPALPRTTSTRVEFEDTWTSLGVVSIVCTCVSLVSLLCVVVTYLALPPLREGTGLSTLAMTCLLFLAQALHEFGLEQYEIHQLCLVLALLLHFFWLSAVFMMTSCTLQLFFSIMFPLRARLTLASRKLLGVSLVSSFSLSAAVIGATVLSNQLIHGDPGYPAKYLCFIDRSMSRQLGFGLPLGLAVTFNVVLFIVTVVHIRRRPHLSSTRQNHVSLVACFRLSVITGACWLSLFLLAVPGTRPWLEYVAVVLLGLQGLLLATTLLLNKRVYNLWRQLCGHSKNRAAALQVSSQQSSGQNGSTLLVQQHSSCQSATTGLSSNNSSIKFDSPNKESLKTEKNSHPSDSDTQTCRL
ncbi:uncharacterized protein [Littorina saxatilis]|uniref:uncharacterized protein n=1 Tax=Littorina saxatilis TaxID=31220 RepID=UPI0038B480FD